MFTFFKNQKRMKRKLNQVFEQNTYSLILLSSLIDIANDVDKKLGLLLKEEEPKPEAIFGSQCFRCPNVMKCLMKGTIDKENCPKVSVAQDYNEDILS